MVIALRYSILLASFIKNSFWPAHSIGMQENVFYSYPLMHSYLRQLRGQTKLILPRAHKAYDAERDGLKALNSNARLLALKGSALSYLEKYPLPTKKVIVPPTQSAYTEFERGVLEKDKRGSAQ